MVDALVDALVGATGFRQNATGLIQRTDDEIDENRIG